MNAMPNAVTLVTGAARGLGKAYCQKLTSLGSSVVANDIDGDALADMVSELAKDGREAIAVAGSVTDPDVAALAVAESIKNFGRLDAVIANAGFLRDRSFGKSTPAEFAEIVDVHLIGTANIARAAWSALRTSAHGRLVLTSSSAGLYGSYGQANYSAAKLGIVGLMNTLKLEGEKYGLFTNVVAPLAHTRLSEGVFPDPLLQAMDSEWIAGIVAHLVSPDCTANGIIIEIGSGKLRRVTIEPSSVLSIAAADKGNPYSARLAIDQLLKLSTNQPRDGAEGVRSILL